MILINSYKKACKVIESCENEIHLEHARRYTNLFFQANSSIANSKKRGFRDVYANDMVGKMYGRLLKKLHVKRLEFN